MNDDVQRLLFGYCTRDVQCMNRSSKSSKSVVWRTSQGNKEGWWLSIHLFQGSYWYLSFLRETQPGRRKPGIYRPGPRSLGCEFNEWMVSETITNTSKSSTACVTMRTPPPPPRARQHNTMYFTYWTKYSEVLLLVLLQDITQRTVIMCREYQTGILAIILAIINIVLGIKEQTYPPRDLQQEIAKVNYYYYTVRACGRFRVYQEFGWGDR